MSGLKSILLVIPILSILFSCSKSKVVQSTFNITVPIQESYAGIMIAQNETTGKNITKKVAAGTNQISMSLPAGKWQFSFVLWDGANPFEGGAICSNDSFDLEGPGRVIDVNLSQSKCGQAFFGGTDSYDASNGFKLLNLHACADVGHVGAATDTCDGVYRGFSASYKLAVLQFDDVNGSAKTVAFETECMNADSTSSNISTALRFPVSGLEGGLEILIKGYPYDNCSGTPASITYKGVVASADSKIFPATTSTEWFARSPAVHRSVVLQTEAGSACDSGASFSGVKINGTYTYKSVATSAGSNYMVKSSSLNYNSAERVLPNTTNPAGEENLVDAVTVGNKVYFITNIENYTRGLFSFDGSSIVSYNTGINSTATDYSNQAGYGDKLIQFGTKVFTTFKETATGDQKLCSINTTTGAFSCGSDDDDYDNFTIIAKNSSGIYYKASKTADSNVDLRHFDGNATHTTIKDLTAASLGSAWPSMYTVGALDFVVLASHPNYYLGMFSGPSVLDMSMAASTVESKNGRGYYVDTSPSPNRVYTFTSSTPVDIETASSADFSTYTSYTFYGSIGDIVYFGASDGANLKIFGFNTSNNALTQIGSDDSIGSVSSVILNNKLYFTKSASTSNVTAIYQISGTTLTTVKVINATSVNWTSLSLIGNRIYFSTDDGVNGVEPWISDGTTDGTFMLKDINSGNGSSYPYFVQQKLGSYVLFKVGTTTYRTEGTVATTQVLFSAPTGLDIYSPRVFDNGYLMNYNYNGTRGVLYFGPQ